MNKEQKIEEIMLTIPQKIVAYDGNPAGQHLYGEQRQEIAEALYNAGYRKTFTSDLASDTQKAYKEGYIKGFADGEEEFETIKNRNAELIKERDDLREKHREYEKPIDKFIKDRESKAVKEFAEKLKNVIHERDYVQGYAEIGLIEEIDELLKEYEK